jgi:hypothetical protein
MYYGDFKRRILLEYSVKLVGWPEDLKEFRNASNIGNDKLREVIALMKTNVCRFEPMTSEEHNKLKEEIEGKLSSNS